jgi:hypothetical protein
MALAITPLLVYLSDAGLASFGATTVSLVFGVIWLGLGKLERQFYNGRDVPPRNLPEKN